MKKLILACMLAFTLSACATSKALVEGVGNVFKSTGDVAEGVVVDATDGVKFVARGVEYVVPKVILEPVETVKDVVDVATTPDKEQPCKHKRRKCK